jgi:hypothetical protein
MPRYEFMITVEDAGGLINIRKRKVRRNGDEAMDEVRRFAEQGVWRWDRGEDVFYPSHMVKRVTVRLAE